MWLTTRFKYIISNLLCHMLLAKKKKKGGGEGDKESKKQLLSFLEVFFLLFVNTHFKVFQIQEAFP